MALLIPALEWNEVSIVGDSTGTSPVITNITSTASIGVGTYVYGAGIIDGSTVLSKTATTVTLSANADSTVIGGTFLFYNRFEFDYPPTEDDGEQYFADQTVNKSISGKTQTVTNYIEARRSLAFGFVSKTDRDILRDNFYVDWVLLGKAFRYYEDKANTSFLVYQNNTKTYKQKRQIKKHPDFLYELDFDFRRVL